MHPRAQLMQVEDQMLGHHMAAAPRLSRRPAGLALARRLTTCSRRFVIEQSLRTLERLDDILGEGSEESPFAGRPCAGALSSKDKGDCIFSCTSARTARWKCE